MKIELCLLWLLCCVFADGFRERGYIVTSPSVFRSNVDHVISVRMFNHAQPVRVNVKLVDQRENLIASVASEIITSGNLTLKVPPGVDGGAMLKVCGNCHLSSGFRFFNSTTVTVINKGSSAFLQTDKPIYKPGQAVYVNIFILNRDLKPINENISVYVVASNEARIGQWNDLRPACCGVIKLSFPLSDQPVLGTWTIYAEIQRNLYNTTFDIAKYVLPKFEVSILPPPFFRNPCEEISIEAMYVFGKPVTGRLEVNLTVHGVGYYQRHFMDVGAPILHEMTIRRRAVVPVCLDDLLPGDLSPHFKGYLHIHARVISDSGAEFSAFDDSTPISRVKANIDFSSDTRGDFKAGIPFTGKIESTYLDGTRASDVSVHVIVLTNREVFFQQDETSDENGIVRFFVPGVPDDTLLVTIKAKITAVGGHRVGEHTSSIVRTLNNWFSPSHCYLLVESPAYKLQINDESRVTVKSTCPCNFTLLYEVLSRGNIVQSGSHLVTPENSRILPARRKRSPQLPDAFPLEMQTIENVVRTYYVFNRCRPSSILSQKQGDKRERAHPTSVVPEEICETSLPINVTSLMAPTSRLLVYYVKSDGEGVADNIVLPVEPELDNEVRVVASEAVTSPGDEVELQVSTDPGSCVCLAVVDRSVHIMKPGYRLNVKQIFNELQTYDLDNSHMYDAWDGTGHRSKRSGGGRSSPESSDAKHAFLESGLVVMTNVVSLDYRPTSKVFDQLMYRSMKESVLREHGQTVDENLNNSGQETFTIQVPDSVTTWRADAISLNSQSGIGVSDPTRLTVVKNFFVDFNLPYSAIRGEVVQIPLTTYNYLDICVEAHIHVFLPPGVFFNESEGRNLTRSVCIQPQTTTTSSFSIRFDQLGLKNLTASIEAYSVSSRCCRNSNSHRGLVATDDIVKSILVEAEGMKRRYTHSVYFCPNERINISTRASRSYQFVRLPANNSNGFDFLVKSDGSVRIILSAEERATNDSFEIVLGGDRNQQCWISRGTGRLLQAHIDFILDPESFKPFWISWVDGDIQVGTGSTPNLASRFMFVQLGDLALSDVNYVGFATDDGASGEFRLWEKESTTADTDTDTDADTDAFFNLKLPPNVVPYSARATASLIGDVMGPTLKNLNNLLSLPFGCGEQNLANFAPNVYVLKYLKGTRQITEQVRMEAVRYLQTGYQRQLTYKRHDGSYSAFGNRDISGSMWLTSFVLKAFAQAREFVYIHPEELQDAKDWIVSWQRRSGSFPPVGKIWNKDIQTGVDGDVALTAYVTVALIEAGFDREESEAVLKAKEYLESRIHDDTDSYTASLIAYALTLLDSDFAEDARARLRERSKGDDSVMYWSLRDSGLEDLGLFEFSFGDSWKQSVASAEVEMTGYALLAFTHTKNQAVSLPIVKWLSKKRNALGGFSSTQDTCVALQALSEYAIFSFIGGINLRVTLGCTSNCSNEFFLNNENDKVLQTAPVEVPTVMFVNAEGVGCALLQVDVHYNIPRFDDKPAFYVNVRFEAADQNTSSSRRGRQGENTEVPASSSRTYEMRVCVRWLGDGSSNMAVLEIHLLTGFEADLESVERLLRQSTINLKRYETPGQTVVFYFDEVYSTCNTCVRFFATRKFETATSKPRTVKIYDYYEPTYLSEVLYSASAEDEQNLSPDADIESSSTASTVSTTSLPVVEEQSWAECRCRHDCDFSGPRVCGSNQIQYRNQCDMTAAACELGIEIEERDEEFCQAAQTEDEEEGDTLEDSLGGLFPFPQEEEEINSTEIPNEESTYEEIIPLEENVIHPALLSNLGVHLIEDPRASEES